MTSDPVAISGLYVDGVNIAGMPVKCGGCGGKFHVLTEKFRNEPPMRGSYLRMIPRYRSWGWYAFAEKEWVIGDNVICPQCGTAYTTLSVMRQVKRFVDEKLGRTEVQSGADAQAACSGMAEGRDGGEVAAQDALGRAEFAEVQHVEGSEDDGWRPVDAGGIDAVDDPDPASPPVEPDTIYPAPDGSPASVKMTVMRMTAEGCTQAQIAKTCNMSIYMIRQIQNGKKV